MATVTKLSDYRKPKSAQEFGAEKLDRITYLEAEIEQIVKDLEYLIALAESWKEER